VTRRCRSTGNTSKYDPIIGEPVADKQVEFIESSAPLGSHIVVADDNLTSIEFCYKGSLNHALPVQAIPSLADIIERAAEVMDATDMRLWGLSPSANFARGSHGDMLGYNTSLGLVYGAFFGLKVTHDPQLYSKHGQIKDDVERTVRYFHTGGIFRFDAFAATKGPQRPGLFKPGGGGISGTMSRLGHEHASRTAIDKLAREFPHYMDVAEGTEVEYKFKRVAGQSRIFEKRTLADGSTPTDYYVVMKNTAPVLSIESSVSRS